MGMISEFKDFAMKGNLVDMAVGFVMGSAFATVVSAFIDGVFMPLLAPVMGGVDFSDVTYTISPAEMNAAGEVIKEAAVVDLGNFIAATISFLIVAFVMFMIIKGMNKMKKKEEEKPSAPPADQVLLAEIRDLLARQNAKL